jgi:hypothetical protein
VAERVKQHHDHHHRDRRHGGQDRPEQGRAGPPATATGAMRRPGQSRPPRRAGAGSRLERGAVRRRVTRGPVTGARVRHRLLLVPRGLVRLRLLHVRLHLRLVCRGRARQLLVRGQRTGRGLERAARFGGAVPIAPLVARRGIRSGNWHRARQADLGETRPARLRRCRCRCRCRCWCLRDCRSRFRPRLGSLGRRGLVDDALPARGTESRTRTQPCPASTAPAAQLCHGTTAHPFNSA